MAEAAPALLFGAKSLARKAFKAPNLRTILAKSGSGAKMELALLVIGTLPWPLEPEVVDFVEINHVCDENAREIFCQAIYWEFDARSSSFRVRAWRLCKGSQIPRGAPLRAVWHDEKTKRLRVSQTRSTRQTWTQHDPEVEDRSVWPQEKRRGLRP